jgi:UDP-2,4-diacetamido-2,4,6-trideoxy-beta-L-altropyranose hydrolase
MTAKPLLLLRADAGPETGAGHVMRCLALAQAWRARGGEAAFAGRIVPALAERLREEGFALHAAPDAGDGEAADIRAALAVLGAATAASGTPGWLALDGYGFTPSWQDAVREAGHRLLLLDDTATLGRYDADILLNQNAFAAQMDYPAPPRTLRLLGLRFALLRREFAELAPREAEPERATRVLVTMGAADARDATRTVLDGLALLAARSGATAAAPLAVTVAVGPANPRRAELERTAAAPGLALEFATPGRDMPARMRAAHVCIAAAGSTSWELAHLGVPALLATTADNQRGIAARLAEAGAAVDLGPTGGDAALTPETVADALEPLLADGARRRAMSAAGRALVDGRGAPRVAALMTTLSGEIPPLFLHDERTATGLRPAGEDDCAALWRLANDPDLRANSFSSAPIPWDDHAAWFARALAAPDVRIRVLEFAGVPAGQVRFERRSEAAEIDYCVAPPFRGLGLGARLLATTAGEAAHALDVDTVRGWVREDNAPSLRCFARAGFARTGEKTHNGARYARFDLRPERDAAYVVASSRPWNRAAFNALAARLPGRWHYVDGREGLTPEFLDRVAPRYVFFPHWSWIVPGEILERHECVCFHMTDVPYGRGGSPLQNLIARGHASTVLTALRMTGELDAGPVYAKRPLSLHGPARAVFARAARLIADLVAEIAAARPEPTAQQGTPVLFARRTPDMSELPHAADAKAVYDHIRMLDAEGYPRAFVLHGGLRLEFEDARLRGGEVLARVRIAPDGSGKNRPYPEETR